MMRKIFSILVIFAFFGNILPALADTAPASEPVKFKQDKLSITTADKKTINFAVEIADSTEQREEGLQNRTSLAADHGMLFIFDEDNYVEMWMKGTSVSLDMLFLDDQGKIIYIAQKTKPESTDIISSKKAAKAVLELAGGVTAKQGIKVGDHVVYSSFKP